MKNIRSKMKALEWTQHFPIITLWELSVAMDTKVPIRSGPKPNAAFPPTNYIDIDSLYIISVVHTPQLTFHGVEVNIQAAGFACIRLLIFLTFRLCLLVECEVLIYTSYFWNIRLMMVANIYFFLLWFNVPVVQLKYRYDWPTGC